MDDAIAYEKICKEGKELKGFKMFTKYYLKCYHKTKTLETRDKPMFRKYIGKALLMMQKVETKFEKTIRNFQIIEILGEKRITN